MTCCRSLVIVYDGRCILQIGFAAEFSNGDGKAVDVDADKLMQGSLYRGVMKSGVRKYLPTTTCCLSSSTFFHVTTHNLNKTAILFCFFRELFGQPISLSWEIRATISAFKYAGLASSVVLYTFFLSSTILLIKNHGVYLHFKDC
mgnify:CR=1 FL=1